MGVVVAMEFDWLLFSNCCVKPIICRASAVFKSCGKVAVETFISPLEFKFFGIREKVVTLGGFFEGEILRRDISLNELLMDFSKKQKKNLRQDSIFPSKKSNSMKTGDLNKSSQKKLKP